MAFSIVIKVEGDEMVARGIRSMGDRARDLHPVARAFAVSVAESDTRTFARAAPNAASTLARKRREHQGETPLVASGRLRQAMTRPSEVARNVQARPSELRFALPGDLFYARFQKTRGGRDVSAVGRDRTARAKIRAALTSHIVP
jgi:hypothetical protein